MNATPVESRLGTDLLYYHEATNSFVLVQYKRLPTLPGDRWIHVDRRLKDQLNRLDAVKALSRDPVAPHDWRLGSDPCFLKLAYWAMEEAVDPGPAPGMYLPVSYVRLLLEDECTRGPQAGRRLGYGYADRYLINTQFIELIKHGLAGTVGNSIEELAALGQARAREEQSVAIAVEGASAPARESVRERQRRNNARGLDKRAAAALRRQPRRTAQEQPSGQEALPGF